MKKNFLSSVFFIAFISFFLFSNCLATVRIMPLGDSITYDNHSGDSRPSSMRNGYRSYLWYELQAGGYDVDFVGSVVAGEAIVPSIDPDNEGHPGWTDSQIESNIYNWLVSTPADIILLHIGTNSLDTSPDDVEDILDEIDRYETNYSTHVKVLLARIINRMSYSSTTTTFNDNVESMAEDRMTAGDDIVIVDMEDGAGINYSTEMIDNLHPTNAGYEKMADLWYSHLTDILSPDCPASMVAYWKLDETSGSSYSDNYDSHTGQASSPAPSPSADGIVEGCQSFNGTSNYITVPDDAAFDWGSEDSFTIELWANFTNVSGRNKVMIGRDEGPGHPHWWLGASQDTGVTTFNLRDSNGNGVALSGTTAINDGDWHHIVAVRDNSVNQNRLYVDGVLEDSDTWDYNAGFGASTTLGIGYMAYDSTPDYFYDGLLDEIAIYNSALSSTDIQSHYTNGLLGKGYCVASDSNSTSFSIKINCGGPTIVDGDITWQSSSSYVTGGDDYTFGMSSVDTTTNSIAAPVPPFDVYKTCQHLSPHTYDIPQVPNGDYIVRIHWVDQYGPVGTRDIDYDIEGVRVQDNWDIAAEAGGINIAIDKTYSVTVSDGNGMQIVSSYDSGNDSFESAIEITSVSVAPVPPTITSIPVTTATVSQLYTYDVEATGTPDPNLSLSVYPSGMTIDQDTGLIEWTPSASGDFDVKVVASNGQLPDANQTFTIAVSDAPQYPAGMVHYYRLDETSGSPYEDSYGDTNATCTNCPTAVSGKVNGAQQFDGSNDGLQIPDDGSFDWAADDSFTIEFWMKTNQMSPPRNMVVIGRDGGPSKLHWWIGTDVSSGKIRFQLKDTSNNGLYLGDKGPVLDDNSWHHVVCLRDESLNENRVYVDGSLVDSGTYNYTANFAESVSVQVGWIDLTDRYWYTGALDELAVYDRALPLSEIQTHYANGLAGIGFGGGGGGTSPTITSTALTTATIGQLYTYDVQASGSPDPNFSLTVFPTGMTINEETGVIQWTPSATGDFDVTIVASNGQLTDAVQNFTISVSLLKYIMPLGDSITDGAAGSSNDTGYRRELYLQLTSAGHSVDFVGSQNSGVTSDFDKDHEGHGGWHANEIRDNVYAWLQENHADIVLLHIGTNDISGDDQDVQEVADILNEIDRYETDYSTKVSVLVARIILRTDSKNPQTIAFNDAVEAMVKARIADGDHLIMVDQENALTYPDDMADSVHPNDSGYSKMADTWFDVLDALLECTVTDFVLRSSSASDLETDDLILDYMLGDNASTAAVNWLVDDSPIMSLYMPMEGGSTNALLDFSGNEYDGSKVGSGTADWQPNYGHDGNGGFYFSGAGLDTGVSMPSGAYTKTAWVKLESGETMNNIISGEQNPGHAFWVSNYNAPDGNLHLSSGHADPWRNVADAEVFAPDVWTFVAVSYDPDVASGTMVLYKNGNSVDSSTGVGSIGSDYRAFIGSYRTSGPYFKGYIDDARIYDRALSSEQILALYNNEPNVVAADEIHAGQTWQAEVTPFSQDAVGLTRISNAIVVQTAQIPSPPTILSTPVTDALLGQVYSYDVDANGLPEPNYILIQAPATMDINSVTGQIAWTPTIVDTYDVVVEANNIYGFNQQSFTITVTDGQSCDAAMTHYWKLDDTSSPYADYVGSNDATCTNCPTSYTGIVDGAQWFDGSNDEVDAADDDTFDWTKDDSFSIEYWMKTDKSTSGNRVIVGRDNPSPSNLHWWIGCDGDGYATFQLRDKNGNGDATRGSVALNNNVWHHIVAVRDNSIDLNILYVDGSPVNTLSWDYTAGFDGTVAMNIGYINLSGHYRYEGAVDEVAVYSRALTPTEIEDHYDNGLIGKGYCTESLGTIVPDCNGLSQAQAQDAIVAASLTVGSITHENSDTVDQGNVITQSPASGVTALIGLAVDLVISDGPVMVNVPDVNGLSLSAAESSIITAGLVVGTVSYDYSFTVADGNVISQSPTAGSSVAINSSVDLVISQGPPMTTVPDVSGLTQSAAETILVAADLVLGTVTNTYSDTVIAGLVIGQTPTTGTSVIENSSVDIVISLGLPIIPNVVDNTQAAAIANITGAGFTVGTITNVYSDTITAGNVISQSNVGAAVSTTLIDLVISYGLPIIPNVTGIAQPEAEAMITAAAFTVGTVTTAYSDTVAEGDVISQSPIGGTAIVSGTAIDMVVSLGNAPLIIFGYVLEPDANTPVANVFIGDIDGPNTVTDVNGYYEIMVDYGWTGTVEPNKTGYIFEPTSIEYSNITADQNDSYIATLDTFIISGYAIDSETLAPLEGVLVSPDSNGGSFTSKYYDAWDTTDVNGYYEVLVDCNWSGKVVPSKYAYVFEPNGIEYINVTEDKAAEQDYVGTLLKYTITGCIKNPCEVAIAGVLIDANNGGGSDITDANGFYEVWVGYNWSGALTPSKAHYTFELSSNVYVNVLDDVIDQNYIGTNIYDLDCSSSIGFGDIAVLRENWLQTSQDIPGDFNKDDIVNFRDYAEFANIWKD